MKLFTVILFVLLGACSGNAMTESEPEVLDLKVIQACVSVLSDHGSGLVQEGALVTGYRNARITHCSLCNSIAVSFGDFLDSAPVAPSYISDKRAPSCSVDKEALEVVYLIAPREPNSMELVEYVEPNLPSAEKSYNELLELSEKEPDTAVQIVERIYSYSQGKWEKSTEKTKKKLLTDIL